MKKTITLRVPIVILSIVTLLVIGFSGGFIYSADKSFSLGYKIAYSELSILIRDGLEEQRDFFISGLPYRFRPQLDKKAVLISKCKGEE